MFDSPFREAEAPMEWRNLLYYYTRKPLNSQGAKTLNFLRSGRFSVESHQNGALLTVEW
jgi:hypothetical protein